MKALSSYDCAFDNVHTKRFLGTTLRAGTGCFVNQALSEREVIGSTKIVWFTKFLLRYSMIKMSMARARWQVHLYASMLQKLRQKTSFKLRWKSQISSLVLSKSAYIIFMNDHRSLSNELLLAEWFKRMARSKNVMFDKLVTAKWQRTMFDAISVEATNDIMKK